MSLGQDSLLWFDFFKKGLPDSKYLSQIIKKLFG